MTAHTTHGVPFRALIEQATRAPSVHNTQPWHWCVDGERLVLFADTSRQLQHADPDGRDLVISCGAALHHLRVASAAAGWKSQVQHMPNPYNDSQLATVSFRPAPVTPEARAALDALQERRTDRRRPAAQPVPRGLMDRLLALGPAAGVTIIAVVSHRARRDLLQVLAEAATAQRLNPAYVDEILRWTGREDDEGIPLTSLVRRNPQANPHEPPSRFPSGTLTDPTSSSAERIEPTLLVISTSSDDTCSWLRAGEALSAVLIKGTADGLAMVPLSQATEVDQTRRLLRNELLEDIACPQILVQVGWPSAASRLPLTPRRPAEEVLGDLASLPLWMGPYHP